MVSSCLTVFVSVLVVLLASHTSARNLNDSNGSSSSAQAEVATVSGINPATITSQSQLGSVPGGYWDHVFNDLPEVLPFAKLWTGGWCPLGYGDPAPLGPGTSKTTCIRCTDGCAVCPSVFYSCDVCIPGYELENGSCEKRLY